MIMKTKKDYFWVLRISNSSTGKVEYHTLMHLTATEVEQVVETLTSINGDLYVAIFKFHKVY